MVSLSVSKSSNWGWWLSPFVIYGPIPSIQVYLRFDSLGGNQGGLIEKLALFELKLGWFSGGL